jgi:CBS domain-containing protein
MDAQDLLNDKAKAGGKLFSVAPSAGMAEVLALLHDRKISSALVLDGEKMVGLITLRELANAAHRLGKDIFSASAAQVMNPTPATVNPGYSLRDLQKLFTEQHITHAPVMEGERLVGIISYHDMARSALAQSDFENQMLKKYIKNWPE